MHTNERNISATRKIIHGLQRLTCMSYLYSQKGILNQNEIEKTVYKNRLNQRVRGQVALSL